MHSIHLSRVLYSNTVWLIRAEKRLKRVQIVLRFTARDAIARRVIAERSTANASRWVLAARICVNASTARIDMTTMYLILVAVVGLANIYPCKCHFIRSSINLHSASISTHTLCCMEETIQKARSNHSITLEHTTRHSLHHK